MYHGKVIYQPAGKAAEYSEWAANFYNGCSAKCEYCYNRTGRAAKVLGCDVPTLKKSLVNERKALEIFTIEVSKNLYELRKHGLFFNFVSDPCLPETIELNGLAIGICVSFNIPVKILTKQTQWIDSFLINNNDSLSRNFLSIGFTLTGHDELELGAATNKERIEAMYKLNLNGFKTWASIEPVIDLDRSMQMIKMTLDFCKFYKIGLQSGKHFDPFSLRRFIDDVNSICKSRKIVVYWKDSLLKQAGINRALLPSNCVNRDFNL